MRVSYFTEQETSLWCILGQALLKCNLLFQFTVPFIARIAVMLIRKCIWRNAVVTSKMTSRRFRSLCQIDHSQLTAEQPAVRPLTHMKTFASFLARSNAHSNQGGYKINTGSVFTTFCTTQTIEASVLGEWSLMIQIPDKDTINPLSIPQHFWGWEKLQYVRRNFISLTEKHSDFPRWSPAYGIYLVH